VRIDLVQPDPATVGWNSRRAPRVYAVMATPVPPARHPGWLKIGGTGCAAVLGFVVVAVAAILTVTFRGYQREAAALGDIDARFGAHDSYRLPSDGAVPADRLARFIAVRRALMPRCAEITEWTGAFRSVGTAAASDAPDVARVFRQAGDAITRVPRLGIIFGAYLNDRNQALLGQGMGIGEYSWCYVVGYLAFLRQPPMRLLAASSQAKVLDDRVYPETANVIARHIEATGLTGGPWVEELARLRANRARVPFADGLPPELVRSLEPSRAALAAAACPAATELDLTITVRRGVIGYDHR